MREPAPPYVGEGPRALWHVSDTRGIRRFDPRPGSDGIARVWAIDTRHLPLYWFPRNCPRGTFWASSATTDADRGELLGGELRAHAVQRDWVPAMDAARLVAYRLPETSFSPHPEVGGYWVSAEPAIPDGVEELGDLRRRHLEAEIELRIIGDLRALWQQVIASTLEFSGMRLSNLGAG